MHVADHALARGDCARQAVLDRVARLVARYGGILAEVVTVVPVLGVRTRIDRIGVVGVHHVACRAAARAVIARLIVGPEKGQVRVVEPRLVDVQDAGADARIRAEPARAELHVRPPGLLGEGAEIGIAHLGDVRAVDPAAPLEGAEGISRLDDVPRRQRHEKRKDALGFFFGRGRRHLVDLLGNAVAAVRFAKDGVLHPDDTVVVCCCPPEDRGGGHHALLHRRHLLEVARPARLLGDAKVARIHEADELRGFVVEQGVGSLRVCRPDPPRPSRIAPAFRVAWEDMCPVHDRKISVAARRCAGVAGARVSAVTIGTAERYLRLWVHRLDPGMARQAADALCIGLFLCLPHQRRRFLILRLGPAPSGDRDQGRCQEEGNRDKTSVGRPSLRTRVTRWPTGPHISFA